MKRILVAEDEENIREFVVINLIRAGYDVLQAPDGAKALDLYQKNADTIDIALLDVMMPGVDGLTVCKKIREVNSGIGIIMLTAKSQEMDKISGLMLGADDYVTKPFSTSELVARIDAVYRRVSLNKPSAPVKSNILINGDFELDLNSRTLTKKGAAIDLTQVEFQLAELFFKKQGEPLSRTEILTCVWGEEYAGEEKIVDVNIRRLRMKIEDDSSSPRHLITLWGIGYKWV